MIHNGHVVGLPLVDYVDTKANIEALSSERGMTAFASDTKRFGVYGGTDWIWLGGAIVHNNTTEKQGGDDSNDEFYHLSKDEHSLMVGQSIPEYEIETAITATLGAGDKVFWLGYEHYYERGHDQIIQVKIDGDIAPASAWSEASQRKAPGNVGNIASYSNKEDYVNQSFKDFVWWILRTSTTASESWQVTIRERFIVTNPLHVSAVKTTNASTQVLDTTTDWVLAGGIGDAGISPQNTNALLVSNCPPGYNIELWRLRSGKNYDVRQTRSRRWRPFLRVSPANGRYIFNSLILGNGHKRHIGTCLYNPTTNARSQVKLCAMLTNSEGFANRKIRVFT